MDNNVSTGIVFCCRSDENNFENLRFYLRVKNSHFLLSGLKPRIGPKCNQMTENQKNETLCLLKLEKIKRPR